MDCPYVVRIEKLEKWREEHSLNYVNDRLENKHFMESLVEAIAANTASHKQLAEEARGIMQLHRDAVGLFRIVKVLQNFAVAVTKWGLIATVVVYFVDFIKANMPNIF